jgi:hypothetical protein
MISNSETPESVMNRLLDFMSQFSFFHGTFETIHIEGLRNPLSTTVGLTSLSKERKGMLEIMFDKRVS